MVHDFMLHAVRKNIRLHTLLGVFVLLALFSTAPSQAQTPSPLTGKTVHVYNPFGQDLPQIDLSGGGNAMTPEGGNWYRYAFTNLQDWMNIFGIRTGNWRWLSNTGVGTTKYDFPASIFESGNDVWIVIDPNGPSTAAPLILTTAPRTLHFFNPWPVSGADVVLNGTKRSLISDKTRCGWEVAYILTSGPVTGYFINSLDGETYGKTGLKDTTSFDFASLFTANGPDLWIGGTPMVSATFPGNLGSCTYLMATTVHDMADTHPDYGGWGPTVGMVEATLPASRKPAPTSLAPANLNTWFTSNPNAAMPLKGAETCLDLEMSKSDDGLWEYDNAEFFPIDHWNTLDQNTSCSSENPPPASSVHNYGFCLESHATFVYKKGQIFEFRGDDDVWVFINNKLALDLGGVHPPTDGSINLDNLGLVEGQSYPWDFYFCERNKCGSSLRIKTTIYFKQQRALDHKAEKQPDGSTIYKVIKRIGGTGACGSSGETMTEVPPGPLSFVLYRLGGDSIQTLPKGNSFGGITVGDSSATVDTAKVIGLAPGTYRIVFFEKSNPNLKDGFNFDVSARNIMAFEAPLTQSAVLGNVIRVTAGNYYRANGKDSLVAGVVTWTPTFPARLMVYADSTRNTRITSGTALSTAPTGQDTLWVFGEETAVTDRTDTLSITGSNKAVVTFTLPPIDLPKAVSAGIYDDDGDGRGDRIVVLYDRDISGKLPISVSHQWPASATAVTVTPSTTHLRGTDTLVFNVSQPSAPILTEGTGTFKSTYKARSNDSIQTLPIADRMAPVITSATTHVSKATGAGAGTDTLILSFSEPLSAASKSVAAQLLFSYKMGDSGVAISLTPAQTLWAADGLSVQLIFASDASPKPKAGDSVRLNGGAGLAADALGNTPSATAPFRIIVGEMLLGIQTLHLHRFNPDLVRLAEPALVATREGSGANIQEVIEKTGRIGVLMEADLADFAIGDGFNPPPPSSVKLEYDLAIFTNLGVPVASQKQSLACDHEVFDRDCRSHRGRIFVGWNYATTTGEKAGTGAYVILFNYRIVSQGEVLASKNKRERWGLLRER
jgi:fibro-slime domain-containing protein